MEWRWSRATTCFWWNIWWTMYLFYAPFAISSRSSSEVCFAIEWNKVHELHHSCTVLMNINYICTHVIRVWYWSNTAQGGKHHVHVLLVGLAASFDLAYAYMNHKHCTCQQLSDRTSRNCVATDQICNGHSVGVVVKQIGCQIQLPEYILLHIHAAASLKSSIPRW